MLDFNRVLQLFSVFSDLTGEPLSLWKPICQNAIATLLPKIKDGVDITANDERLSACAAAIAYADYLLLEGASSSSGQEVKVGSIAFKNTEGTNQLRSDSESIKRYFLKQVSDLLSPEDFAFITVGDKHKSAK